MRDDAYPRASRCQQLTRPEGIPLTIARWASGVKNVRVKGAELATVQSGRRNLA